MLTTTRGVSSNDRSRRPQTSTVENLEMRRLLTATPTLVGATMNISGGAATLWIDSTANSGSAIIKEQVFNGSSWTTFGTTAGGTNAWDTHGGSFSSSDTEFRVIATEGGVDSLPSNLITVERSTDAPVAPTIEQASGDGNGNFSFEWTGSTAYTENDTLRVQYATTTTAGTVWTDVNTTEAASTYPVDSFSLDSSVTEFRVRVENSNGNSDWTGFSM